MGRKFIPRHTEWIDSPRRGPNFQYKVSYGPEEWEEGVVVDVLKVQLVEGGKVKGRLNTSIPIEGEEGRKVIDAIQKVFSKSRGENA